MATRPLPQITPIQTGDQRIDRFEQNVASAVNPTLRFGATMIQGRDVAATAPTDGQVLAWNAADGEWEPESVSGAGAVTAVTASAPLASSGGATPNITITDPLPVANGGTGVSGFTSVSSVAGAPGPLVANDIATGSYLAHAKNTVLRSDSSTVLAFGAVDLAAMVSGQLAVANGGTGAATASAALSNLGGVATTRQVIAGTGLSGGGSLSADVTLSLPSIGTAGTYGDASTVPVITTDAEGRVSGVTSTTVVSAPTRTALDANDYLAWLCNESAAPLVNGGSAGSSGDLDSPNSNVPTYARVGLYADALYIQPGSSSVGITASGSTALEPAYPITVSAWFYSFGIYTGAELVSKAYKPPGTWTSPFIAVALATTTGGLPTGSVTVSGTEHTVTAASVDKLIVGQWNFVAMTYDGTTIRLYVNGVQSATLAQTGAIDYGTHGRWLLGTSPNNGATSQFIIQDARVATVARDAAYVRATYKAGIGRNY